MQPFESIDFLLLRQQEIELDPTDTITYQSLYCTALQSMKMTVQGTRARVNGTEFFTGEALYGQIVRDLAMETDGSLGAEVLPVGGTCPVSIAELPQFPIVFNPPVQEQGSFDVDIWYTIQPSMQTRVQTSRGRQ